MLQRPLPLTWNYTSDDYGDDDEKPGGGGKTASSDHGGFTNGLKRSEELQEKYWGEILEKSFSTRSIHRVASPVVAVTSQPSAPEPRRGLAAVQGAATRWKTMSLRELSLMRDRREEGEEEDGLSSCSSRSLGPGTSKKRGRRINRFHDNKYVAEMEAAEAEDEQEDDDDWEEEIDEVAYDGFISSI